MTERIVELLWADPQQQIPAGYCSRCGGALYPPGRHCIRCEEESYDP